MPFLSIGLTHMLTWVTVGRYSHLSRRSCLALQQYFVAHGKVNQLAHHMAPVAHSLLLSYGTILTVRGRLNVYESVYDSPFDSMNNLPKSQIGIQFFIRHLLQWSVYTFQQKLIKN
jgi:hypothetical protein